MRRNENTYFLTSEEGEIRFSAASGDVGAKAKLQDPPCRKRPSSHWGIEDRVSLGGFELLQGDGTATDLFNVPWLGGRGLR